MYDNLLSEISIFKHSATLSAAVDYIDPARANRVIEDWLQGQRRAIRTQTQWSLVSIICVIAIVLSQLAFFPDAPGTFSSIAVLILIAVMFGRSVVAERRQNLQRDEILFALWRSMHEPEFEDVLDDGPQLRVFR